MLEITKTTGSLGYVWQNTFIGVNEIRHVKVGPYTSIKESGDKYWKVWIRLCDKAAFVAMKDEDHSFENNTAREIELITIKGKYCYTYNQIADLLAASGCMVHHGSLALG